MIKKYSMTSGILTIFVLTLINTAFAQRDSTFYFRSALSVTNNGFSIIPAFTLGKPAAMLDMSMGNKRLSFEPQFRYALEGRPWSFVFIYRYKVITKPKFQLTFGGHIPGLNFVTKTITTNGVSENYSVARRFLALEIMPNYVIKKNFSVGMYFLRGHGFQIDKPQDSYFLSLRTTIAQVRIIKKLYADFSPQVFYLALDADDGYFVNATTTLAIKDFPFSISSIVNKAITSDIAAKDFDWNISLLYTIDKQFKRRQAQ
jgi:hypothetical protein